MKDALTPRKPVRGSTTGRPIMALLDVCGRRWTLRIMWELRDGPVRFRNLRTRCEGISPTLLSARLKELTSLNLIRADDQGYALTTYGEELGAVFTQLDSWADGWAASLDIAED